MYTKGQKWIYLKCEIWLNRFLNFPIGLDRREKGSLFLGSEGCLGVGRGRGVLLSHPLLSAFGGHRQCSFFLDVSTISNNYCFQLNNSRHSLPREKNDLGHSWASALHSHSNSVYSDGRSHYRVLIASPSPDGSDYFLNATVLLKENPHSRNTIFFRFLFFFSFLMQR